MSNPFDTPPLGDPVSFDPPSQGSGRRGRMAVVALLTAGLVGGGIVGVSALASADRPSTVAATPDEPAPAPEPTVPDDADDSGEDSNSSEPHQDGRIEVVVDDGEPIVIDLGDHGGETVDGLLECLPGLPDFEFDLDPGDFDLGEREGSGQLELSELFDDFDPGAWIEALPIEEFGNVAGGVTVDTGDGISIVDLGENGSVTISTDDGEVSIETTGDATVEDLTDVFGDLPFDLEVLDGRLADGDVVERLDEALGNVAESLPVIEDIDGDEIRSCLDEVLGH